jgi:bifunctional non-homologous end joining protein LigD
MDSFMTDPREEHVYMRSQKNGADKDYNLHLEPDGHGQWRLVYENGKHGAAMKRKEKIEGSVSYEQGKAVFDATMKDKMKSGGYVPQNAGVAYQNVIPADRVSGIAPQLLKSIPTELVHKRMADPAYMWQEKKDGERRMIRKTTEGEGASATVTVIGTNRDGLIVPIPQELAEAVAALPLTFCVLDGEDMGQGRYAAFDLVATADDPAGQRRCEDRYLALQQLLRAAPSPYWIAVETAYTPADAKALNKAVFDAGGEGLVGKLKDAPYTPGVNEDQFKFPYLDRATVYVESHDGSKRSVHIAVLDAAGKPMPLKKVTIPANYDMPPVGAVVDVEYLYAHATGGLAQPRYKGIRTDRQLEHCVASQLKYKSEDACLPLAAIALGADYSSAEDEESDEEEALGMAPGC